MVLGKACLSITPTIPSSPPKEIHHLSRRATTPSIINMRLSIPIIFLLIRLGELSVVLLQNTSPIPTSTVIRRSTIDFVVVKARRIGAWSSAVLEIVERGLGLGG